MLRRTGTIASGSALVAAAALLGSCAAATSEGPPGVGAAEGAPVVVGASTAGPASASPSGGIDHIVLDDTGAYFCVLRRPDDLARLRAQFSASG
ncbi:MAG: hypothetical protein DHS20C19_10550 [Acidimicrobiales bacterium]|nr:MAG: hypothetical protein DHS20C19_10550 [Acidimicrobiales bacterium]